jgi:biopolymer transport protein ExbD
MKLPSPVRRKHTRIEIIPLIDIMFFLLASFMMVSLQLDQTLNIKIALPSATQAAHVFKPDMINVAVDKQGGVWLAKEKVTLAELGTTLSNRFKTDPDAPVYLSGDRDTLHGAMVDVLDTVRRAGVQKVDFMVDEGETQTNTAP